MLGMGIFSALTINRLLIHSNIPDNLQPNCMGQQSRCKLYVLSKCGIKTSRTSYFQQFSPSGGGLYAGTGGIGKGVSTESSMYQVGFGGVLVPIWRAKSKQSKRQ